MFFHSIGFLIKFCKYTLGKDYKNNKVMNINLTEACIR